MPKILIAEACQLAGEEVSTHADIGESHDVSKDDALLLTRMGRAFYVDKADDPTKGRLTAAEDDKARIKRQAAALKASREARVEAEQVVTPQGIAALVAKAVADALAAQSAK